MAFVYSARFRRCSVGRPGLGCSSAARSSSVSSIPTRPSDHRLCPAAAFSRAASPPSEACGRPSPRTQCSRRRGDVERVKREARPIFSLRVVAGMQYFVQLPA